MKILVYANCGTFGTIEEAAAGEKSVNWWDDNDPGQKYCTECHAAIEIRNHLRLSGFEAVSGNIRESAEDIFILVGADAINDAGFVPDEAGIDGSYECREKDGKLHVMVWGRNRCGTLNAAHMWLHSLGFRWYSPDEECSYIPAEPEIRECRADLRFDYLTRACYNEFIDDDNPGFLEWASRNCMNMLRVNKFLNPHRVKKLGLQIMGGGHEIFYRYLNPNDIYPYDTGTAESSSYFDIHPEWFALVDGKRSRRDENKRATEGYYTGDNICTSNPGAVAELARNMIESFNDGDYMNLDYLNLWAYDNGNWCTCGECRNTGNLSRRMLMLGYEINRHFMKAYEEGKIKRRIKLVVPVYHETLEPPDKPLPDDFDYDYIIATYFPIERCYAHDINDPCCTESNLRLKDLYERWADRDNGNYKGDIFIGEYYNVSSFASLPFIFTRTMRNDIPYYYLTGTRHLYYMHISACKWGMLSLNNNVLSGLMKNVSFDADKWFDEFYRNYYPQCGEIMREFHDILKDASMNSKYLKHYQFAEDGRILSLIGEISKPEKFPLAHCKFDSMEADPNSSVSFSETMGLFDKAGKVMNRALKIVSGIEKERVEREFMRFDYGHKVMEFIYTYTKLRSALDEGSDEDAGKLFAIIEIMREELLAITEPLDEMKYECPWYANAYGATWHSDGYDKLRAKRLE